MAADYGQKGVDPYGVFILHVHMLAQNALGCSTTLHASYMLYTLIQSEVRRDRRTNHPSCHSSSAGAMEDWKNNGRIDGYSTKGAADLSLNPRPDCTFPSLMHHTRHGSPSLYFAIDWDTGTLTRFFITRNRILETQAITKRGNQRPGARAVAYMPICLHGRGLGCG